MKHVLTALLALLALAACASTGVRDAQKLGLYRDNAGEPVSSFNFFGRINGWTPLGDSAVAVWTRPREAWLLELHGPCPDLSFAHAISLTSTMNRVHARFDKVMALGGGSIEIPCHIREIRPLDVSAIREAEREMREEGPGAGAQPDPSPSGT